MNKKLIKALRILSVTGFMLITKMNLIFGADIQQLQVDAQEQEGKQEGVVHKKKGKGKGKKAIKKIKKQQKETDHDNDGDKNENHSAKKHDWTPEQKRKMMIARNAEWQQNGNSLAQLSAKAIANDSTNATAKTLQEIAAITDDQLRRIELFEYQEAAKGQTIAAGDQETYKVMVKKELEEQVIALQQARELFDNQIADSNYSIMTEEEILTTSKKCLEPLYERKWHAKGTNNNKKNSKRPRRKSADFIDKNENGVNERNEERKENKKKKNKGGKKGAKKAKKMKNKKTEADNKNEN